MINISNLTSTSLTLKEGNCRGTYFNTPMQRSMLQQHLSKIGQSIVWDEVILPAWGTDATISDPSNDIEVSAFRTSRQTDIKKWCNNNIIAGFDIDLGLIGDKGEPLGVLHYSLPDRHQSDMRDLVDMIKAGATQVTWRDDSRVSHMIYTAEQFMQLYNAATKFILECRFHSDALEELLFSYADDDIESIQSLSWDTELPADIAQRKDELLKIMLPV